MVETTQHRQTEPGHTAHMTQEDFTRLALNFLFFFLLFSSLSYDFPLSSPAFHLPPLSPSLRSTLSHFFRPLSYFFFFLFFILSFPPFLTFFFAPPLSPTLHSHSSFFISSSSSSSSSPLSPSPLHFLTPLPPFRMLGPLGWLLGGLVKSSQL